METRELSVLAEAMNGMAKDLDEKIEAAVRQRNEMETVLSSMVEGVLAIDQNDSIISLNEAAARLFNIDIKLSPGKALHNTIRNMDLYRIVKRTFSTGQTVEGELTLKQDVEKIIQVHGTLLKNATGETNGILLVFNDLTRIKQLESLRRDFVANVSHEIKTPLTSIKGYVETLLNGAMYDKIDAEKFLKIVLKQADRLNGIVNDLLSLSKIENDNEKGIFFLTRCSLLDVIETAVLNCQAIAKERRVTVEVSCDKLFMAQVNPPFLEQALVNLVSNAIQYSQYGKIVRVEVEEKRDEMVIKVEDNGSGISSEHLPRIFERFYRVDKARSRNAGGTGLGLAIVKHIAQGHKGRVSVESEPGKGSVFSLFLKK
jgi:two-component system phosphate regulon sensor histidine kinase PhoR